MDLSVVLEHLRKESGRLLADLRQLVEHESPTGDVERLDALAELIATRWEAFGGTVHRHHLDAVGTHLELRWNPAGDGAPPGLVLCHMDTVHAVGMLERNPLREEDGRLYGPGTQDMKAGIVITLHAVAAMQTLGIAPKRPVTVLVTADEETGSASSRELIERVARDSAHALVVEPAGTDGAVKTERKGVAQYQLDVIGVAAHAGMDFERGVSANVELSRLVLALHALVDTATGTTVNIGLMHGGTGVNTVPEHASAQVDVRFLDDSEAERVDRAIRSFAVVPGASLTVSGGVNRPAMRRSPESARLFQHARSLAASMGVDLGEVAVGGASDGNFTAAAGVATLDGLGAVGAGLHTADEYALMASLPVRAALLAGLLATR